MSTTTSSSSMCVSSISTGLVPATVSTMQLHTTSTLRSSYVVTSTLKRYESAVDSFLAFCAHHSLADCSPSEVDTNLSHYMESLYHNDIAGGKQKAADTLFGIIRRCPQMKLLFPLSRQALKGFQTLVPSISHKPMTYHICVAVAAVMAKSGYRDRAIALLLMFHCYLRISEMDILLISDVALPGDNKFGTNTIYSALRIAQAKTGKNQTVTINDPHIHTLLQVVINNRPISEKLFSFSSSAFVRTFDASTAALGLTSFHLVPHSCRHGGATYDHINGLSIEQIMLRGRWKSNESARTYIQSLRALVLTIDIPAHVHTMGKSCAVDLSTNLLALSQ
jgi:integrase